MQYTDVNNLDMSACISQTQVVFLIFVNNLIFKGTCTRPKHKMSPIRQCSRLILNLYAIILKAIVFLEFSFIYKCVKCYCNVGKCFCFVSPPPPTTTIKMSNSYFVCLIFQYSKYLKGLECLLHTN